MRKKCLTSNGVSPGGTATTSSTLTFLSTDHLDTPVLATTAAAGVRWSGGFTPFGGDYAGAQAAGVFLRLPGQWEDVVWRKAGGSGFAYNVQRWYQAGLGRYSRPDPLRQPYASEAYAYADGNPITMSDPLGLFVGSVFGPGPEDIAPPGLSPCQVPPQLQCCLEQIFGESVGGISVFANSLMSKLHNNYYTTRRNTIYLPGNCSRFFNDEWLVLHEYYHVVDQWNTSRLTVRLYLLEAAIQKMMGKDPHKDNRYEKEADAFANNHDQLLRRCLQQGGLP